VEAVPDEFFFREHPGIGIIVPVFPVQSEHVFEILFSVFFRPDVLGQCAASAHIEALGSKAYPEHGKFRIGLQERREAFILESSEEMKNKGKLQKVAVSGVDAG
jgi:hypothetical protein